MPDERNDKSKIGITHYIHGKRDYSLSIHLEDVHIDLSTSHFGSHPGNHAEFTIFSLTADDIQDLATLLANKALKLKATELRGTITGDPTTEETADARSR